MFFPLVFRLPVAFPFSGCLERIIGKTWKTATDAPLLFSVAGAA